VFISSSAVSWTSSSISRTVFSRYLHFTLHLTIPCCKVAPQQLPYSQTFTKLSLLYRTWKLNTTFTSACYMSLYCARSNQSLLSHSTSSKYKFPIYAQVFQVMPYTMLSPPKHYVHLSCILYVPHVPPYSYLHTWSTEWYLKSSKS
jgi:hypothetical protein